MTLKAVLPCRILLVDDEENILRAISRLLIEEEELTVETAASGEEGLRLLEQFDDVAVILSDQRMPGMGGAEFLQQAREIAPDAVRMILTGYADINATMDAINKGGAARYITKPWDDAMLLRALREGIDQYRLLRENRRLTLLVEQQKAELEQWNANLKNRVLEQTTTIRRQYGELKENNQRVEQAFHQTILAFSRMAELHGARLKDHLRNVSTLAVQCGVELGLGGEELETLRVASLLHDIGVIGTDPDVINASNITMTRDQFNSYKEHPVRGQAALDVVEDLRGAGVLIRHHHERYDGKGFPDGLAGIEIPLGSRIIAFADLIDRELAGGRTESAIQGVIAMCKSRLGSALDPELFAPMMKHLRESYLGPGCSQKAEREYHPSQLQPGLVIARNLYSGTGLLLLTAGTVLDAVKIASISRYYQIDPPREWVMAREGETS